MNKITNFDVTSKIEVEALIDCAIIRQVRESDKLPELTEAEYKKILAEVKKQPEYQKLMNGLLF